MKNKTNYTELVQKYLNNDLTTHEQDAFEKELKQNKLLREELNLQKNLDCFIQDDDLENFKLELDEVYDNLIRKKQKKRFLGIGSLSFAAASIVLIVTLGIVFLTNSGRKFSSDEIFKEYYEGYPSAYTTRSVEPCVKNDQYADALLQYEAKNYIGAKESFIVVSKNHPNNIASKFYLGIVHIELKDYDNAIRNFSKVIESNDQFYKEQSEWYKALCLVKLGRKTEAITGLNAIVEHKGFYRSHAEEILSKLE